MLLVSTMQEYVVIGTELDPAIPQNATGRESMEGICSVDDVGGTASQFLPWIDPTSNEVAPVVLVGAGLSFGLAPRAHELAIEIAGKREQVERSLGITTNCAIGCARELYRWAEVCLDKLVTAGTQLAEAKKDLADAMGLTRSPQFLACANIPIRGTTARHRVLSRLAREGRVSALWSFNWDCWLEISLESVGLRNSTRILRKRIAPTDWKLHYLVWVDSEKGVTTDDTVPVFKAHGCLRALNEGKGDFVIAEGEMAKGLAEQSPDRVARMEKETTDRWTVALGWSASEGYVRELMAQHASAGLLGKRLTIVDINPSGEHHQEICGHYGCDPASVGVSVRPAGPGTADDLFLWIQTMRGLASIREATNESAELKPVLMDLESRTPAFDSPDFRNFWCVSLLDSWLPVWLKTCFLTGAHDYRTKPGSGQEIMPSDQRDAHIPWGLDLYSRRDLRAVVGLLDALGRGTHVNRWDFETFPGALWEAKQQLIVIPVPIWVGLDGISVISLKPLIESTHWENKGRIRTVFLTPLGCCENKIDALEESARLLRWKEAVSSAFNHTHLASPDSIRTVWLDQLSGEKTWENPHA